MRVAERQLHSTTRFALTVSAVAVALLYPPGSLARNDPRSQYGDAEIAEQRPVGRVGGILIIGNKRTYQSVTLDRLELYPGEFFTLAGLKAAERRLAWSKLFKVDARRGIRPSVRAQAPRGEEKPEFWDIVVEVEEEPFAPWAITISDTLQLAGTWAIEGPPGVLYQDYGLFPRDVVRFCCTGDVNDLPYPKIWFLLPE
jgi:hypothetical protein